VQTPGGSEGSSETVLSGLRRSIGALGALDDELRRGLYLYARERARPVTREEAAVHAGISERLAAFHLDKLVKKGLLKASYARKPGRSGPGAGRSSKFYELSDIQIDVTIPERSYDFVGEILVGALASSEQGRDPKDAARDIASKRGRDVGARVRRELKIRRLGPKRALAVAQDALQRLGFEPHLTEEGVVSLRNCPFHKLARQAPELICGINQSFIDGLLRGLGDDSISAALEPTEGRCCVNLKTAS
jgi:predicted ArsR family transcriptional regulator